MLMKSLPEIERPIEKACARGVEALSNVELLALIIHTGTRSKSALNLAEDLLSHMNRGIVELGNIVLDELTAIDGIGKTKACSILAAVELGKRLATHPRRNRVSIESSSEVADMFMEELRYERKEHFKSLMLNSKGEIIMVDDVSVGELASAPVHPREVFSQAVRNSAAGVIFVHNHPSGDPTPSSDDLRTTRRLIESGDILGIRVLDHIIIGDGNFSSLRAMNLID